MTSFISETSSFVAALRDAKKKKDRERLISYLTLFGLKEIGFGSGRVFDATVSRKLTEKVADQILASKEKFSDIEITFEGHGPYRLTDFAAKIGLPALLRITHAICVKYKLPYVEMTLRRFLETKRLKGKVLKEQLALYEKCGIEADKVFHLPALEKPNGSPCVMIGVPNFLISAKPTPTALKKRKEALSKTLTKSSSYPASSAQNIIICMGITHYNKVTAHFEGSDDYEAKFSKSSSPVSWTFFKNKKVSWLVLFCEDGDKYKCSSHFARIFGMDRLTARVAIIGTFNPNGSLEHDCCYVDQVYYRSRKGNEFQLPAEPLKGVEKYTGKVYGTSKARSYRLAGNAVLSGPAVKIYYLQQYFNRIVKDDGSLFQKPFIALVDQENEEEGLEYLLSKLLENMPKSEPRNVMEFVKEFEKGNRIECFEDSE